MRVSTLIDSISYIDAVGIDDIVDDIQGISYNSKKVQRGDLFICLTGEHVDGHEYAEEAVSNGAVVCVVERRLRDQQVAQGQVAPVACGTYHNRPHQCYCWWR